VRGKTIFWLALLALLFGGMLPTLSFGQGTIVYIDPPAVHNEDMSIDIFSLDINVEDVTDLYGFAFTLDFAPFGRSLSFSACAEGNFLTQGGYETDFDYVVDNFEGKVKVGNARLGQVPGASGDGLLATINLKVTEAVDTALDYSMDLEDVELYDDNGDPIPCSVGGSHYYGPYLDLTSASWSVTGKWGGDRPYIHWKDTLTFESSVTHTYGTAPLQVKVKFDLTRADGFVNTVWAGQTVNPFPRAPQLLYADGWYDYWETGDWIPTTDRTQVLNAPDGQYTEATEGYPDHYGITGAYTFEDIVLGPEDAIDRVYLEGYCQYPMGATGDMDIDVYSVTPVVFTWLGSLYGGSTPAWVEPRWIDPETECVSCVIPQLRGGDPTALNDFSVFLFAYYTTPDLFGTPMRCDCLRLRVEFATKFPMDDPIFIIEEGETLDLDPVTWVLTKDIRGYYPSVHVTCFYSYFYPAVGYQWIKAETEIDLPVIWIPGQGPGPGD